LTIFGVINKVAIDVDNVFFFGLFVVVEKDVIDGSCVLLCEVRLAADGRIAAWAVTT
jgi:hypothetical protein